MLFKLTPELIFKVDSLDFLKKYPIKFWKYSKTQKHLYYRKKKIYISYVELIEGPFPVYHYYILIDNDPFNLLKNNIKYIDLTPKNKKIIEGSSGHKVGYRWVNPYWKISNPTKRDYYIMHIKNDIYFKFSIKHLDMIKTKSWFQSSADYPATHYNGRTIYLHKIILEKSGFCSDLLKIKHLNSNKLDNRVHNIEIVNPDKLDIVKGKKKKKINFKKINAIIPTWVSYTQQYQNHGDYFKLKIYIGNKSIIKRTTKSMKVPIEQKLIDVLIMRAKIVNENQELLKHKIDNKQFDNIKQFLNHTKKLVNKYSQRAELDIDIDKLDFSKLITYNYSKKPRQLEKFPEETIHEPSDLPKYTIYIPAKGNKGSFIEFKKIDTTKNKIIRFKTTSRKGVSLDNKFKEIKRLIGAVMGKKRRYVLKR